MKCSVCGHKIKSKEPSNCFLEYHRQYKGKDWKPDKGFTFFKFSQISVNEIEGTNTYSIVLFCSSKCLEEWCRDIADNGYWRQ